MESKMAILIVEDDVDISTMLKTALELNGYMVCNAYSGTEALLWAERINFDVILLDLMLPGLSGEEVLKQIRRKSDVMVMAVSAMGNLDMKIQMLKNGADDYMTKPFHMEELLARIEALYRRKTPEGKTRPTVLKFEDLEIDLNTLAVTLALQEIELTKSEYHILELLMSNPKKVFTKNNIFDAIWGENYYGDDNTLNVHISKIRAKFAKINPSREYIKTVWGLGFKMNS